MNALDLEQFRNAIAVAAVAPHPVLVCADKYAEQIAPELNAICTCYGIDIVRDARRMLVYRCVDLDRLPTILQTGRDADPSDGVFYASDCLDKALEYGGREQVLMVYDPRRVRPAWVTIGPDCSTADRDEIERLYPTMVYEDGATTKRSRLPASEYQAGIDYDHYAYWIPGEPLQALVTVVTIGRPGYPLAKEVDRMISDCRTPVWRSGSAEERAAVLGRFTDSARLTLRR